MNGPRYNTFRGGEVWSRKRKKEEVKIYLYPKNQKRERHQQGKSKVITIEGTLRGTKSTITRRKSAIGKKKKKKNGKRKTLDLSGRVFEQRIFQQSATDTQQGNLDIK